MSAAPRITVRIRATCVRPLACASLGESVVQTGLGYPVTLAAVACHHHDGSRPRDKRSLHRDSAQAAVAQVRRLWRKSGEREVDGRDCLTLRSG